MANKNPTRTIEMGSGDEGHPIEATDCEDGYWALCSGLVFRCPGSEFAVQRAKACRESHLWHRGPSVDLKQPDPLCHCHHD